MGTNHKKRCELVLSSDTLNILDERKKALGYSNRSDVMRYLIHNDNIETNNERMIPRNVHSMVITNSLILTLIVVILIVKVIF